MKSGDLKIPSSLVGFGSGHAEGRHFESTVRMPVGPQTGCLCYGVAVGVAILFGGGGGVIRQSINFQTASTSNAVMIAATKRRVDVELLREGIDALRQPKIEIS